MNSAFYFKILKGIGARYLIGAGIAFLLAYVLLNKYIAHRKIQRRYPAIKDYAREIGYSFFTIGILALFPLVLLRHEAIRPLTTYYTNIQEHGWVYFVAAFPIMLILHDTYFYWMHRLIHHPALFQWVHRVHHLSTNPSPWAAYAFHPLEAVAEGGIIALFLFTIPVHQWHLFFFFLFMILYNIYGHLGWELYPKGFHKHPIGRWINTSVNHNMHHQFFKGNYGLYFLFWDRMMGTLRSDYDDRYESVASRPKP